MSKFDAAISLMECALDGLPKKSAHADSLRSSIRLLKAASKVDKGLCLFVFDRTYPLELESFPMIHDLLASLPDEETK